MLKLLKSFLGTSNDSALKAFRPVLAGVGQLEPEMQARSDAELRELSAQLINKVRKDGVALEQVRLEAFALVREAADRRLGMMNAILEKKPGFDDEWFGAEAFAKVTEAREAIANGAPEGELDFPAQVYAAVREKFPVSARPSVCAHMMFRCLVQRFSMRAGLLKCVRVKVKRWLPVLLPT